MDTMQNATRLQVITANRNQEGTIPKTITTTLFDLFAALQDVVGPEGDARVIEMVDTIQLAGLLRHHRQIAMA